MENLKAEVFLGWNRMEKKNNKHPQQKDLARK